MVEGEISFGRFRLDLARRELRRDQTPVQLGMDWPIFQTGVYPDRMESRASGEHTAIRFLFS